MVVTTIFAYFLNNIFSYAYFFLKIGILYLYNTFKIIQFSILLSDLQAFISNIIFKGKRSFNSPSIPSRLIFTHSLSSFHHHLRPPHHNSPTTTPNNLAASPSPPLRDVGPTSHPTAPSQARMQSQPPLPFSKGCGRLIIARRRSGGWKNMRGNPGSASRKWAMTFVVARFLPFLPVRPS
jgi:hypothetical protein